MPKRGAASRQGYVSCRSCGRGYWPAIETRARTESATGTLVGRLFASRRNTDGDPWHRCVFCYSVDVAEAPPPEITPALLGITRAVPESPGPQISEPDAEPTVAARTASGDSAIGRLRGV